VFTRAYLINLQKKVLVVGIRSYLSHKLLEMPAIEKVIASSLSLPSEWVFKHDLY
jgi:hypothetical protein